MNTEIQKEWLAGGYKKFTSDKWTKMFMKCSFIDKTDKIQKITSAVFDVFDDAIKYGLLNDFICQSIDVLSDCRYFDVLEYGGDTPTLMYVYDGLTALSDERDYVSPPYEERRVPPFFHSWQEWQFFVTVMCRLDWVDYGTSPRVSFLSVPSNFVKRKGGHELEPYVASLLLVLVMETLKRFPWEDSDIETKEDYFEKIMKLLGVDNFYELERK